MGMTIEDIIQGLKETYMICCSVFAYDRKKYIDGAIDRLHKYQMMQADYNARLKADMVAMLEDLDLKIDEMYEPQFSKEGMDGFYWAQGLFKALVQEEINALKEAADDQSGAG